MQRLIVLAAVTLLVASATAEDLTTVTTDTGRYLSVLGKNDGATMVWGEATGPTGIHDIASNAGNGERGFGFTDGELAPANGVVTWGTGQPLGPHYQGLKFKRAALINSLDWHNFIYGDGGTFAATPTVEVYDRGTDSWTSVSASWSTPYDSNFGSGIRPYGITLDTPVVADGVRLIGDAAASPGPHPFVGTAELVVNGSVSWGVDITNDLTDLPGTTGIISDAQFGNPDSLVDNDLTTYETTVFAEENGVPSDQDYVGAMFAETQNDVAGFGVVFKRFFDGGLLDSFVIETYDAATDTWTAVTGVDTSTYYDDFNYLTTTGPIGVEVGYLFTFDAADGVDGIRIFGPGWGTAYGDGFLAASEVEVFQIPEPMTGLLLAIGCALLRRR